MSSSQKFSVMRDAPPCVVKRGGGAIIDGRHVESRSEVVELGDLRQGRIVEVLGEPVASGARVNEKTALGVPAFAACVNLKAEMIAKLPIDLFQRSKGSKPPKEIEDHPSLDVIRLPGDLHTEFELRRMMQIGEGMGGNGYGRVFRDRLGNPGAIEWLKPCDVQPYKMKRPNGNSYVAFEVEGESDPLSRYDVIHIKGDSIDGIVGQSKVHQLKDSLGNSISQRTAAGKLIANGARWPGYFTVDGVSDEEKLRQIRDEVNGKMAGVMNAGKLPVIGGNLTWHQTNGMSMSEAEFMESRQFELQEICRLHRVLPFMVGDTSSSTSWGTGLEQQTLAFLSFCLDPHLVSWEQSLAATLLTTEEIRSGYYFEFDRDKLMNATLEARSKFYQIMRQIGSYSVNDVRGKMGESHVEGGDNYAQPLNSNIKAEAEPKPATTPTDGE